MKDDLNSNDNFGDLSADDPFCAPIQNSENPFSSEEPVKEEASVGTGTVEFGTIQSFTDSEKIDENVFSAENNAEEIKSVFDINEGKKKKKSKKGLIIGIVCAALIIILGALAVLLGPGILIEKGDEMVAQGNYAQAAKYYKMCFGANDSTARLNAVEAIIKMTDKSPEEGVKSALQDGIAVEVYYNSHDGQYIGDPRDTITFTKNDNFVRFAELEKEHYDFDGWQVDTVVYEPYIDALMIKLSLNAQFSPTQYVINYHEVEAEEREATKNRVSYTYDDDTFTLVNPTRTGYTFAGWEGTGIDGHTYKVTIQKGSFGQRDYRAVWKANEYDVIFDPEIDYEMDRLKTVAFDSQYAFQKIKRDGYDHTAWLDDNNTEYPFSGTWKTPSEVNLKPKWSIIDFKLEYKGLDGVNAPKNPTTYTVESEDVKIEDPERLGYTFLGWTYDEWSDDDETFEAQAVPKTGFVIKKGTFRNYVFTANWEGHWHKIIFDYAGAPNGQGALDVQFGENYHLNDALRTGYRFLGWYDASGTKYTSGVWNQDNGVNLKARWDANKYTVKFNVNGGKPAARDMTATYDAQFTLPSVSRDGYTFLGWYNGNTKVESGPWRVASNVTLKAEWRAKQYTVKFNANGGNISKQSMTVNYGEYCELPEPEKLGYNFAGWYSGNTKYTSGKWTKDSGITLEAKWTAAKYNVTFNSNGGSNVQGITVTYGANYNLSEPTRKGYIFDGWYSGSIKFNQSGNWKTAAAVKLEAHWIAKEYTVEFNPGNSGTVSTKKMAVTYDGGFSPPIPTRKGYKFLGWYEGNTKYSAGTWTSDKNVKLEAKWEAEKYTVTFDADGGSLSKKKDTFIYGQSYTFPTPSREGYEFVGWYNSRTKVSTRGTYDWDYDLKLEASWEGLEYTIRLDPAGGEVYDDLEVEVCCGEFYELPDAEKPGYEFIGWFYGNTKIAFADIWTIAGNVTLKAKYDVAEYEITLDPCGGKVSDKKIEIEYGDWYTLPTPSRRGYEFVGWYDGLTHIASSGTWNYTEDLYLEAEWESIEYSIILNARGGSVSQTVIYVEYGEDFELPIPQKAGYEFDGWYTADGEYVDDGTFETLNDLTLYAEYSLIEP